jgi:hypothetical protein
MLSIIMILFLVAIFSFSTGAKIILLFPLKRSPVSHFHLLIILMIPYACTTSKHNLSGSCLLTNWIWIDILKAKPLLLYLFSLQF